MMKRRWDASVIGGLAVKTVLIGKQKGGVGASTTARELAVAAADAGQTVALVDLDPQRTLSKWWARRQAVMPVAQGNQANPALITVSHSGLPEALKRLAAAGIDLVLIDTPPSIHGYVLALARDCDLVLAPVRASADDLDALKAFLDALDPSVQFAFVITQAPSRSRLYDDALALLAERGRVAPPLRFRSDFAAAAGTGRTAFEATGTKAAQEVRDLWRWLTETMAPRPVSHDASVLGHKRARAK
jgi:chromosome partitioning protein